MQTALRRLWRLVHEHSQKGDTVSDLSATEEQKDLRRDLHKTIAKVSDDVGRRLAFNTAIAAIMELMNKLTRATQETEQDRALMQEALEAIVRMLSQSSLMLVLLCGALGGKGR